MRLVVAPLHSLRPLAIFLQINENPETMSRDIKESDWKIFRQLREVALERFCERVLSEITQLASDTSKTSHERYSAIYRRLLERDKELAKAFDGPRRSVAWFQLVSIQALELLKVEEMERFSEEMRESIRHVNEVMRGS
jgi:hypothetical protein